MNQNLKWPAVVVILGLVIVLGFLAYHDKDVTAVLAGIIAVLGALGFGYTFNKQSEIQQSTAKIEENTNGRIGQMNETIQKQQRDLAEVNDRHRRDMKEMAERLATMTPPAPDNPSSVSGGGAGATWREGPHSSDL